MMSSAAERALMDLAGIAALLDCVLYGVLVFFQTHFIACYEGDMREASAKSGSAQHFCVNFRGSVPDAEHLSYSHSDARPRTEN